MFTRRWVAEVMLDLVGYTADRDLAEFRLVEPACGVGAMLVPVVDRLIKSTLAHAGVIDDRLANAICASDVQMSNVVKCRDAVVAALLRFRVDVVTAETLAAQWVCQADYLLSARATSDLMQHEVEPDIDFVLANPPYVRFENIDETVRAQYRSRWTTMSGKADIYVGFYERALRSLKPGGRLAFICADRWMRNQYGANLRKLVGHEYGVEVLWSLHDVDAFETPVAAYPAITVIGRHAQGAVVVADTTSEFAEAAARELVNWTLCSSGVGKKGAGYQAYRLQRWFSGSEMWPAGGPARMSLIKHLNENFDPLQCAVTGTRVGIGVTTGADEVYVRGAGDPTLVGVEADRLLRLSAGRDIRTGVFEWGENYLVNPWDRNGELVDLAKYPGLASYLERHRSRLVARHTAKAHPQGWYRTIDKVNHELLSREKLLIRDLQSSLCPVLENQECYPHHNLYYIVSGHWDLCVLGGLLMSDVVQAFVEAYSVRMRGGTLRFQAQYLKKIRVPAWDRLTESVSGALRDAFRQRDRRAATRAALLAYDLNPEDLVEVRRETGECQPA
ncbi:Eco57I restriction-modification methylase domain-containing protein [Lentzea sp. NPDC058450]|uniref:Eco57I restriction-modification methylase domain-containing protein n=1 Tax=Lentzea sp. NPDC058450 TaxID=3346505 RepID=UPI00365771CA